ncbi:hypothetical protein L484_001953 [Morus notabilis]|uniref:Aminotransferase-like plant mobile domain-containing protein n=1 Tax=Morus notabilis TaxID=981085 RepID=W9S4L0_9ROSA|nr:hypothetical protein L484_001953 [Morus notabilis]
MAQNLAITDPFFCDLPIEAVNEGDDHDSRFFFSDSSRRSFLGSPQIDLAAAPLAFRRHPRDLDLLSIEFSDHRPYLEAFRHLTRACFHHHRQRLAEAGILRPIWAAAHLFTDISPRALKELILRWSPPSKAFWRSGGWTTPTGEDVDSLSELSFEDDKNLVNMSFGPNEVLLYDQLQKMTTALTKLGRELYISNWMSFLQRSVKADSVPFLTGVLCVWLQLFICPSKSNILHPRVYRLACCLSAGHKIPLGSLFLGNTYLELDGIIKSFLDGALHVSTSLNAQFLMLFIFERFPTVAPTRNASTHSLVDYFDPEFFYSSFPRAILWHNVKVDPNMSIELALNHAALYCERPYLSRYSNIASVTYPGIVRDVGCFMSKNIISHVHFETWIATLLPHAVVQDTESMNVDLVIELPEIDTLMWNRLDISSDVVLFDVDAILTI